jgi:hypothetical protein
MTAPGVGRLRFLYVGVDDTEAALATYVDDLGATPRWRFQRFGADVAGVELGDGTLVLLADHRPTGTVLPIWTTDDLGALAARLRAEGLEVAGPEGTPEGDVIVVEVGGHQQAFLQVVRPDALDGAYRDPSNSHRVPGRDTDP